MVYLVEQVSKHPLSKVDANLDAAKGTVETRLLESTLDKITSLLKVGFGEAGSGIISSNLGVDDTSYSSVIKAVIPGIRVYAIVGFCDIHHFEDIEERLKKDILTFVNTLAEIVHSTVQHWGGQCNKNLGNAFVVIWRIGDEESLMAQTNARRRSALDPSASAATRRLNNIQESQPAVAQTGVRVGSEGAIAAATALDSGTEEYGTRTSLSSVTQQQGKKKKTSQALDLRRVPGIDVMADRALIAYLKIIAEINRNKQVLAFRSDPRLTLDDTQQYKVRMGFGLHAGWAIEGAVGSDYKVDATYLSPHVNMAARLETASKQYGVPLLFSQVRRSHITIVYKPLLLLYLSYYSCVEFV